MFKSNRFLAIIILFLLVVVIGSCGGGGKGSGTGGSEVTGAGDSSSSGGTTDITDKVAISGTVSPPPGTSSDSLIIVSLDDTSIVDVTGSFSTEVYKEGVAVVAAMSGSKEFGLMNVVATSTTETPSAKGTYEQIKMVAAYKTDSISLIELSPKTTAVSMVFVTPYFSTNDPEKATSLISIIEHDPKVLALGDVIESVFNESDPMENPILQAALGEAIASVLDTIQASVQSTSKASSTPALYSSKVIQLPKRSPEFSSNLTKVVATPYSIDTYYIRLNISESSESYSIDVDSIQANAVDWIGEIGKLDAYQFISLSDLEDKATNRFNTYDRASTVGRDRASAKGFLRWIDIIGTSIDTAFSYFSSDGVNVSSNTDGVYIVRSFSGGGWGADFEERDFLSQVPNGDLDDKTALALNVVSAALDGASAVVDLKGLVDTPCLVSVISTTVDSVAGEALIFTSVEDLIVFVPNVSYDITLGLIGCVSKTATKNFLKFIGKITLKSAKEVAKWVSQYKWVEMAATTGKIIERGTKLYTYATPLESVFVVVGSPFLSDVAFPSTPTVFTATAVSSNQVNLSWDASTDDISVTGYNVYRDGVFLKSVTGTSTFDTGLSADIEYCYAVSAYDVAGNESGQSIETCATTQSFEIILQPGPGEGKDIWTTSVYSYAPGGGGPGGGLDNERLEMGGWGDSYYILIEFDLTALPPVALSARIELFVWQSKGYGNTGVYLDRITEFWDWRIQGTGSDLERLWWADRPSATQWVSSSLSAPTVGQWYSIDITDLYNAWQDGTYPNYGVQLRPVSNNNRWNEFYSSDYINNPSLRPKLVVIP